MLSSAQRSCKGSSHKSSRSSRSRSIFSKGTEYAKLEAATKKVELQCRMEALKLKQALEKKEHDLKQQKEMIDLQTELHVEEAKIATIEKFESDNDSQALSDDELPNILIDDNVSVSRWLENSDKAKLPSSDLERHGSKFAMSSLDAGVEYKPPNIDDLEFEGAAQGEHIAVNSKPLIRKYASRLSSQEKTMELFTPQSEIQQEMVGEQSMHTMECSRVQSSLQSAYPQNKVKGQNKGPMIAQPEFQFKDSTSTNEVEQLNHSTPHHKTIETQPYMYHSDEHRRKSTTQHEGARLKVSGDYHGDQLTMADDSYQQQWRPPNTITHDNMVGGCRPKLTRPTKQATPGVEIKPEPPVIKQDDLSSNQQFFGNLTNFLVDQHNHIGLPQRTIKEFTGDPLDYASFISSFEYTIERKVKDNKGRLYYLEQYTKGEPNRLVRSCLHLREEECYQEAKNLLERNFGSKHKIAEAYLSKLRQWPKIPRDNPSSLQELSLFLIECKNTVSNLNYSTELDSTSNIKMVVAKLHYTLQEKWKTVAFNIEEEQERVVKFSDLINFVERHAKIATNPSFGNIPKPDEPEKNNNNNNKGKQQGKRSRGSSFATSAQTQAEADNKQKGDSTDSTKQACCYCKKNNHSLENCWSLKKLPISERLKYLRTKNVCFGCLKTAKHVSKDCKCRLTCNKCQRRHPTVLHDDKASKSEGPTESSSQDKSTKDNNDSNATCGLTGAGDKASKYFPVMLPVKVKSKNSGKEILTYAFLDDGSNSVFCSENLQRKLNAKGRKTKLKIETLNQTKEVHSTVLDDLEITDINNENTIPLPEVFTQKKIPASKENIVKQHDIDSWNYLQKVKLHEIDMPDTEIGILIGNNVPKAMEPMEVISSEGLGPFAVRTRLGWTVHGVKNKGSSHTAVINRIDVKQREDMHRDLVNMYNMEFSERLVDDTPQRSKEDQQFIDMLSVSTTFVDGHYQVGLPLKSNDVVFPNNRPLAEQRAAHLRRRFMKDEVFKEEYKDVMSKMISKGYAEEVPSESKERNDGKVWYIPHHGVHHPRKGKLRVVYDCGATYKSASLNKELLQGPNLTNNLVGVLSRFRSEPVALMADIESMYYQVKVPVNERDMLRFLWWRDGDINSPLCEYRMTAHIFGAVSSPACAIYALNKVADEVDDNIGDVIRDNFYVDDLLCSTGSESSAINLADGLMEACMSRGFNLTKWVSNHRNVLKSIPESERAKEVKNMDLGQDQLPTETALGMTWYVETDDFGYRLAVKKHPHTRRGILSCVSSMYDPLGFISPALIPAKQIMQDLCRLQIGWDDKIPTEVLARWQNWLSDIPMLSSFNVSRCIKPPNFGEPVETQLHHFCDASESAYGTVSYLRLVNKHGDVHCQIVLGKARVAPLKQISIPRLELTAATVAVRVDNLIKRELKLEVDSTWFWTDSTTVLKYLNNQKTRFHTFVANRIAVIAEATKPEQWRYVPSAQNPADDCSRGMKVQSLLKSTRWIAGPDFLQRPECYWPRNIINNSNMDLDDLEVKKAATSAAVQTTEEPKGSLDMLIEHYSSWYTLRRAVAWVLRVKKFLLQRIKNKKPREIKDLHNNDQEDENTKEHKTRDNHRLTLCDIQEAEMVIISHVQRQSFPEEIRDLCRSNPVQNHEDPRRQQKHGCVKKSSAIYKLNPVYTTDGLLRVGGRLSKSAMPEHTKHPLILPKKSHVTDIILRDIHYSTGHSGRSHMLACLHKKYWVIAANSAARSIIHQCVTCRRQKGRVGEQMMSDLPADRITPDDPPFTKVGVDYFGPFEVKRGRSLVKRYGVIFTCLSTRAIHLEKADSLEMDSCISAIRRFMSRRGQVKEMRSDNGSNLVGAEKEMRNEINKWNQAQIQDYLLQKNVEWRFNPPAGSHFGGVWERQIRTVRKVMLAVMKEQQLTDESLVTYLCEVEAIVNSRPITAVSGDARDLEPLTPNHLLLLKGKPLLPPTLTDEKDTYARKRWKQVQYLSDLFWKRWSKEYLCQLQQRQKWIQPKENFKVGDIVLIVDNSRPRNSWQLGRVTSTMPGEDGLVRQVQVKTKTSTLVRPIAKLCLLLEPDIHDKEPEVTKASNEAQQDKSPSDKDTSNSRKSKRIIKPRQILDL